MNHVGTESSSICKLKLSCQYMYDSDIISVCYYVCIITISLIRSEFYNNNNNNRSLSRVGETLKNKPHGTTIK